MLIGLSLSVADMPARTEGVTLEAALAPHAERFGLRGKIAEIVAGKAVSWELETSDDSEIAAAGAVLVEAPIGDLVAGFRDLEILRKRGVVVAWGRFSAEAKPTDLDALEIPAPTARAIERARARKSDVKLSGQEIDAVRRVRVTDRGSAYKRALVERVRGWRARGLAGLVAYEDKKGKLDLAKETGELLEGLSRSRPAGEIPLDAHFQYWSLERFGSLKPIVAATDMRVARAGGAARIETIQIYASHYFDGLATAVDLAEVPTEVGPATLVRITFRARLDLFEGLLGGIKRRVGRSRTVEELAGNLERLRAAYARPREQTELRPLGPDDDVVDRRKRQWTARWADTTRPAEAGRV
jgi:hypothetical protein